MLDVSITDQASLMKAEHRDMITSHTLESLARYEDAIERVRLSFSDENGPKGGEDKQCRAEVKLHAGQLIFGTANAIGWYESADAALKKIKVQMDKIHAKRITGRHDNLGIPPVEESDLIDEEFEGESAIKAF